MFVCVLLYTILFSVSESLKVVEFQPQRVTFPDLGSAANAYIYYIPPTSIVPTVLWIFFPPPPWTYILQRLHFPQSTTLLSLIAPASTHMNLARARSDCPPGTFMVHQRK